MIVDHQNKVIFVHIPKTAGSTIVRHWDKYYKKTRTSDALQHIRLTEISKIYPFTEKQFKEYFKFCVVRNPYDRICSAYYYTKQRNNLKVSNFEEFVFDCKNSPVCEYPQTEYIFDDNGKLLADKVIHFENLKKELEPILIRYDLPTIYKNELVTKRDRLNYMKEFNASMIRKVNDYYARDFELLKYSKYSVIPMI